MPYSKQPAPKEGPAAWKFAIRALSARNYRLFFTGQSVSLIGTWMTRVATAWLVYRLTKSAFLLGIVGFAGQAPLFFLAPLAGVWVDRWNRHRALVATQVLSMVQSFALAVLALGGWIRLWEILALSVLQGVINAVDMPARQSFVVQMIDKRDDLGNAIALNSTMVNGARLVGPALAGLIIAGVGEGYCFLLDGLSYVAVIVSLLLMRVPPLGIVREPGNVGRELADGWNYAAHFAPIRSILVLLALTSLVGMPYSVLMPVFAGTVLHGGPHTLGFLMGASGLGALAGAVVLAARKSVLGLGRVIVGSSMIFGLSLAAFGFSHVVWLSLLLMVLTGFGMMRQMASSNTVLQTIVEEEKRGRVMSLYSMAFQGMLPFGSLLAGALAAKIGAPHTVSLCGLLCLAGTAWFYRQLPAIRKQLRPIYEDLGIVRPKPAENVVAQGINAATVLRDPPGG